MLKGRISLIVACLAICLGFHSCIYEKPDRTDLMTGDIIPDFTVMMNDSTQLSGEMLRTAPSCVVFFHTTCPDCQQVLPLIQKLYEKYAPSGVVFALISREQENVEVSAYWQEKSFTMPYSAQPTREVYNLFAQTRVPRVYICEKGGVIRNIHTDDPVPTFDVLDVQVSSVCGSGKE